MNKSTIQESLEKLYGKKEAQKIADDLYNDEDERTLRELDRLLRLAKGQLLADLAAHKKDRKAIEMILEEIKELKDDIDTDAFLLKIAKRLSK